MSKIKYIDEICKAVGLKSTGAYSLLKSIEERESINFRAFRINIGQNFPGSVGALAEVRGKKIQEINHTRVTYTEVLKVLEHLNKHYKSND